MTYGAVLCDMDGTLVDSDAAVERSWRTWAGRWGVDVDALFAVVTGYPAEATIRRMRPDLDEAGVATAVADQLELECTDVDDVVAAPGAPELVDHLTRTGLPWAVVTSADTRLAAARLGAAGITAPVVVARDELGAGKPNPEGYLVAASRLGVCPEHCLVVEDSPVGVAAGRAAGAHVAGLRGVAADLPVATLHDVVALLTPVEVRA